jgi:O-antigen ligase
MTDSSGQTAVLDSADSSFGIRRHRHRSPSLSAKQSVYEWSVLILAAAGPIAGPWLFGGVRIWSTGSLLLLTFIAGVLFGLRPLLFRSSGHPIFPAAMPILLFFLIFGASRIASATAPYDALLDVVRNAGLVLAFWIWADFSGGHHDRWRWLMSLLLLSAAAMSLYALIINSHGSRHVLMLERPLVYEMRASGAFMCPNHFASFIGMMVPLAVALILCRDSGYPLRLFSAYALIVIPPALYLTGSRSGWMGTALGFVVVSILLAARKSWRSFWLSVVAAPLAVAVVAFAVWTLSPMVQQRVEAATKGDVRLQLWQDTVQMIKDSPVLGVGPGGFRWAFPRYWQELKIYTDPEHAHNETLESLADYGIAGTALLFAGVAIAAGTLLFRLRGTSRDKDAALIAGALGAGVAVVVQSCFDYNFHVFGVASSIIMIGGIATSALFSSGAIARREWCSTTVRRIAGAVTALISLVLLALIARAVTSNLFWLQAERARAKLDYTTAETAYRRAIAVDSRNPDAWLGYGHLLRIRAMWSFDAEQKKADIARAAEAYNAALARNPSSLETGVSLALLYNLSGEADRALSMLQDIAAKAPLHRDNLCTLGLQLRQMGRSAEALEVFRRAQKIESNEMVEINIRELESLSAPK